MLWSPKTRITSTSRYMRKDTAVLQYRLCPSRLRDTNQLAEQLYLSQTVSLIGIDTWTCRYNKGSRIQKGGVPLPWFILQQRGLLSISCRSRTWCTQHSVDRSCHVPPHTDYLTEVSYYHQPTGKPSMTPSICTSRARSGKRKTI